MFKKLMLLAVSVTALVAFAVPAVAQATATVTDGEGGAPTTITAFSSNTKSNTPNGTLFCNEIELHITLSQNDTTRATGSGSGTAMHEGTQECEITQIKAKVVTVTQILVPHIQLNPGGTGSATFTYVYDVTNAGVTTKCHFEGTAAVTYTSGSSSIKIAGSLTGKKIEGEGTCSTGGSIAGDFAVSDIFGGAAIVH